MDPCPFLRIRVGNLALKLQTQPSSSSSATITLTTLKQQPTPSLTSAPLSTSTSTSTSSPSSSAPFYYCKIKFANFPQQTATLPLSPPDAATGATVLAAGSPSAACFSLSKPDLDRLLAAEKKRSRTKKQQLALSLKIDVYASRRGGAGTWFGGGVGSGKFMGRVCVAVADLAMERPGPIYNGWVSLRGEGKGNIGGPQLYVSVKADPDPRFVFEFEGEPECSPQVFQVQGSKKQPVFTCKFGFRNSGDWNSRASSLASEPSTSTSCWGTPLKDHTSPNHLRDERKGWTVTIHDLSGSPIAAASMVTPFVPSPGSDRVSKSNPGAWLILRPGDGTWKPWGRLEAWRDRSPNGSYSLGHRFEIIPDPTSINASAAGGSGGVTLSTGSDISTKNGGKFTIDIGSYNSPMTSPSSSFDLGSWSGSGSAGSGSDCGSGFLWWPQFMYRGFVMSATVGGEKQSGKGPELEVGVQHVNCAEDAAVFVALAAAMNLCMDACMPFSKKLSKELRQKRNFGEIAV